MKEEAPSMLAMTDEELQALSEDQLRTCLGNLPHFDYLKQRKEIAKKLSFTAADLDGFRQKPENEEQQQGSVINLYEPLPWEGPVIGADVLSEASSIIRKHMVMRQVDADACVLWAAHSHVYGIFSHTPRLLITAPDAECGKTLLMVHMVGDMCTRPMAFELMKPAPFFRIAELYKPTYLIDEADMFLRSDAEILAAINAGWEPHGKVPRCGGDDQEVRIFSTYCPVVLAGIEMHKHLKSTTIGRSVVINLDRAGPGELLGITKYNRRLHKKKILDIGRKLSKWCNTNKEYFRTHLPTMPVGIMSRAEDKWTSLLTIADIAGGDWPERARTALMHQPDISEPNRTVQLLSDMFKIIGDKKGIFTRDLIPALCRIEGAPWKDYNYTQYEPIHKRITDVQIGRLLSRYGVEHGSIRLGEENLKGYSGDAIKTAHGRYVPESAKTLLQGDANNSGHIPKFPVTPSQTAVDTAEEVICDAVTDYLPPEPPVHKEIISSGVIAYSVKTGSPLLDD